MNLPPVLVLIYNRPEHTERCLQRLAELGVQTIYVAADGPADKPDKLKCDAARLKCHESGFTLKTNFSNSHLGCRNAVVRGINWFFDHVDEGLIIEDDCLPTKAFLLFSAALLKRYRNEPSVYMISGNNPLGKWESGNSHHFARIGHIWGWATWKDRWAAFDPVLPELVEFEANHGFVRLFGNTALAAYTAQKVGASLRGEIDTWDYQWTLCHAMHNRLAAVPCENLVENVGFGSGSTHTHERPDWISHHVHKTPLDIGESDIVPNREYETSLQMARRMNAAALQSSHHFALKATTSGQPRLKILQINTTDLGGGAEAMAMMIHRSLLAKGHDARFLVAVKKKDEEGVIRMEKDVLAQIRGLSPDVVHVHNLHGTGLSLTSLSVLADQVPILWTLHDEWLLSGSTNHPILTDASSLSFLDREKWNDELSERHRIVHHPNIRLTAPSQWLRDSILDVHAVASHFVQNCAERSLETLAAPHDRPYLLFVANHADRNPRKDIATLRKAWRNVTDELAIDLVCIGGQPCRQSHGKGAFIMLERQSTATVLSYMSGAIALVQASVQENAPLTIMEAHSVGTPIIGSMAGGIPEMLCPDEAALLFPVSDTDALEHSIRTAITNRSELRDAVQAYFHSEATAPHPADIFVGHYLDMIRG